MKPYLFPVLAVLAVVLLAACTRKMAEAPATTPTSPSTPAPSSDRPAYEPKPDVYQVVGYQKTACFGKCPVYQVKFYSDGHVTWYGQMNVDRKGWHDATVSKELLKSIRDKAHEVKYWDFQINYPQGRKVADLPSTVTYIRAGDMEKTVVNVHQAPAELEAFEDYLEGIINGLGWKATSGK